MVMSSARYEGSYSRRMAALFKKIAPKIIPDLQIKIRDLTAEPPPPLSDEVIQGFFKRVKSDQERVSAALLPSERLVNELLVSDVIVLALPMYNFSVPSNLKAWIDLVVRPGLTFRKVRDGVLEGLCNDKKMVVLCSMAGKFSDHRNNFVEPYLKLIAQFIGITDIQFVYIEGTAHDDFIASDALNQCGKRLEEILKEAADC